MYIYVNNLTCHWFAIVSRHEAAMTELEIVRGEKASMQLQLTAAEKETGVLQRKIFMLRSVDLATSSISRSADKSCQANLAKVRLNVAQTHRFTLIHSYTWYLL